MPSRIGRSPGGKTGSSGTGKGPAVNSLGVVNPIPGFSGFSYDFGIDCSAPIGAHILAPADCSVVPSSYQPTWFNNTYPYLAYKFDNPLPGAPSQHWYISEGIRLLATGTHHFKAGEAVATYTGPPIEIGWADDANPGIRLGEAKLGHAADHQPGGGAGNDPTNIYGIGFQNFFSIGGGSPALGHVTASGSSGGASSGGGGSNAAMADAFSTFIQLPSIFDSAEALAFTGKRSFIADQPLFPFVQQLAQASMRDFMSMPNGNFFAFFPDYFGLFGRKYYWEVRDIEILDGRIDLSDDSLVTHVAVAGDVTQFHASVDVFDLILTSGIFDIFDAFTTQVIGTSDVNLSLANPTAATSKKTAKVTKQTALANKQAALNFLQVYGARPYVEEVPAIRSPFFELFYAFQTFMLLWAKQFQTTFELTFMPEIFPGGLVAFPDHHIQCYIEEVVHDFDYVNGFTTNISVIAPSALTPAKRTNISEGLARGFLTGVAQVVKANQN